MRVVILGIGALGCLFGARLSPHADVTLVGNWPEQVQTLQRGTLRVVGCTGEEDRIALRVRDDIRQVGEVEVALVLTKSTKTAAAAQAAMRVLAADGLAITLQNGLGNLEILQRSVGIPRATSGVTTLGASTGGQPGVVICGGEGKTVLAQRAAQDVRVGEVAALLERAGLKTDVTYDVSSLVWGKLAINAAVNPLTAILGVPNGALLESEWARALMCQAATEVAEVAAAQQIALPFDDVVQHVEQAARVTGRNRSSMLQDVERHAATEIDAICGAVVRIGEELGISTPVNRTLHALVKALEATYGAQGRVGSV